MKSCRWVSGSDVSKFANILNILGNPSSLRRLLPLKMKLQSFETSETISQRVRRHIPEDMNPQKHLCENLISHSFEMLWMNWNSTVYRSRSSSSSSPTYAGCPFSVLVS